MKAVVFMLFLFVVTHGFAQTEFQRGYKDGYKKGYCLEDPTCRPPAVINVPRYQPGYSSYQDGFNKGLIDGKEATSKDGSISNSINRGYESVGSNARKSGLDAYNSSLQNERGRYIQPISESQKEAIAASVVPLSQRSSPLFKPNPRRKTRQLKKLDVVVKHSFNVVALPPKEDGTMGSDPMNIGPKMEQALSEFGYTIDQGSVYRMKFNYTYRPDMVCGGVVLSALVMSINNVETGETVAHCTFEQGPMEGKCIDDVLYQVVLELSNSRTPQNGMTPKNNYQGQPNSDIGTSQEGSSYMVGDYVEIQDKGHKYKGQVIRCTATTVVVQFTDIRGKLRRKFYKVNETILPKAL